MKDSIFSSDFEEEINIRGTAYHLLPEHYEWRGDSMPVMIEDEKKVEELDKKCKGKLLTSNNPPVGNSAEPTVEDNEKTPTPDTGKSSSPSPTASTSVPTPIIPKSDPITVSAVYSQLSGDISNEEEKQACINLHGDGVNYIEKFYTLEEVLCQRSHRNENSCLEESISWLHNVQRRYTCKVDRHFHNSTLSCPVQFSETVYNCVKSINEQLKSSH